MPEEHSSADKRTYTVGPAGRSKRWRVYSRRAGTPDIVYSEHATESAALKMMARKNAECSGGKTP